MYSMIKEPKTYLDSIRPLLRFNFSIGMGVYRYENQSKTSYFLMKLQTVVFNLFIWATTYIGLISMNRILNFDNSSPLAYNMYRLLVITNSCLAIGAPVLIFQRRKKMKDSISRMATLDDRFSRIFGSRNEYKKEYVRLTLNIFSIVVVMTFVGVCDMLLSLEVQLHVDNFSSLLTFVSVAMTLHQPILVMLLLDLNFSVFLGYLAKKFRDLNETILQLANTSVIRSGEKRRVFVSGNVSTLFQGGDEVGNNKIDDKYYMLHEIRKAHLELSKLCRKINRAFGIQNLLSMGISFVMITGLFYTIYCVFSWKNFTLNRLKEVIPSLTWVLIYAYKIWRVNHSSWVVSNESDKTGEVLYELLKPRIDRELQKEVQEFAVQMLQNPVRFNACGFFTLDYTFVQGVIGSITTYLVILIQMSQVPKPAAFDLLANGTAI